MVIKETKDKIEINKMLEHADLRFFDNKKISANIQLKPKIKIQKQDIDAFGENFKFKKSGFVNFLFLD